MEWLAVAAVVAAGLVLADRLLLRAEDRGWIYYRKRKAASGAVSSAAFGPVLDLLQPSRQVFVEEQQHQEMMREADGDETGPRPA